MGMIFSIYFLLTWYLPTVLWLVDVTTNFLAKIFTMYPSLIYLSSFLNNYTKLVNLTFFALSLLIILLIIKSKLFDTKTLIKNSIKFRIIIFVISYISIYIWGNAIYMYILLYSLIIFSFLISNKNRKIETFYKLAFILSFWYLCYNSTDVIQHLCNLDINVWMEVFLTNYILSEFDLYSNMSYTDLKNVFITLHEILKDSNWKPPKNNPFSVPPYNDRDRDYEVTFTTNCSQIHSFIENFKNINYNEQDIKNYEDLFIPIIHNNINMYNLFRPLNLSYDEVLENNEFKIAREQIDLNNNNLKHIEKKDFIQEKAKLKEKLVNNSYVDDVFYTSSFLYHDNLILASCKPLVKENFLFHRLPHDIIHLAAQYNQLMAAKFHYENHIINNKDIQYLPKEFKKAWDRFYVSNTSYFLKNYRDLTSYGINIPNMLRKDLAYNEILDNILIVGSSFLSLIYVHDNVYKDFFGPDNDIFDLKNITDVEFFEKVWTYYAQSISKYYSLFSMYNWYCKLYMLNEHSRDEILQDYKETGRYPSVHKRYDGYDNKPSILYAMRGDFDMEAFVSEMGNGPFKVSRNILEIKHDMKNFDAKKFYTDGIFYKDVWELKHDVRKPIIDLNKIFPIKDMYYKKIHYR